MTWFNFIMFLFGFLTIGIVIGAWCKPGEEIRREIVEDFLERIDNEGYGIGIVFDEYSDYLTTDFRKEDLDEIKKDFIETGISAGGWH